MALQTVTLVFLNMDTRHTRSSCQHLAQSSGIIFNKILLAWSCLIKVLNLIVTIIAFFGALNYASLLKGY